MADRAWVRLPSGRRLDLLSPTPFDWTDADLATGLARTFRWGGHSTWPEPLSVAQHSLLVEAIEATGRTPGAVEDVASPLHRLEHGLQPWVAFAVVPIFGFANAGVSFAGTSFAALLAPIPLGVAAGLFLGKQIGVFGVSWLAIRLNIADLPARATWRQFYGVSVLCGIGFTMSLFIGLSAFSSPGQQDAVKLGVLVGSGLSALVGMAVLLPRPR